MTIGANIKKLRRERDITQEQLAAYLSISPQAVSQWETDKTAPDISQLPALANVFGVTTDRLLGVDITKSNEKIKAIVDEATAFYNKAQFESAVTVLEKGLREFPRSFEIMHNLADNLSNLRKHKEAIELCNKILAECTDDCIRSSTMQTLIYARRNSGDKVGAISLAKTLSPIWCSREDMLFMLLGIMDYDDEKLREESKTLITDYIAFMTARMMMCLESLARYQFGYSDDDRIRLLRQAAAIGETIHCDGDANFSAQFLHDAYMYLDWIYAKRKDTENLLECIEKECKYAVQFETYDFDALCSSPAVRGYHSGGWMPSPDGETHATCLLKRLIEDNKYDFIRGSDRFSAVIDELESCEGRF